MVAPVTDRAFSGRRSTRDRRRRRAAALVGGTAVITVIAAAVAVVRYVTQPLPRATECVVTVNDATYPRAFYLAANAATIAAVAQEAGLPDHAVTVALAAALQESNLHNLGYGDRDSVGLFQQRPSQGWGDPAQLTTPKFAAAAFYRELARLTSWAALAVTDAAQQVQRSGAPSAYAKWESEARDLAVALAGEIPAAVACRFRDTGPARDYVSALRSELGRADLSVLTPTQAWTAAAWLVTHADQYGIESVTYAGRRWTPNTAEWRKAETAGDGLEVTQAGQQLAR
jgi:hypothetical protein